jgi:hypothetical protein
MKNSILTSFEIETVHAKGNGVSRAVHSRTEFGDEKMKMLLIPR